MKCLESRQIIGYPGSTEQQREKRKQKKLCKSIGYPGSTEQQQTERGKRNKLCKIDDKTKCVQWTM